MTFDRSDASKNASKDLLRLEDVAYAKIASNINALMLPSILFVSLSLNNLLFRSLFHTLLSLCGCAAYVCVCVRVCVCVCISLTFAEKRTRNRKKMVEIFHVFGGVEITQWVFLTHAMLPMLLFFSMKK